ncbi:MAG: prepilin-type N-terminal cleavage/methylation domain-containing protein, partial [Verrucomicrobiaceae bacterium]
MKTAASASSRMRVAVVRQTSFPTLQHSGARGFTLLEMTMVLFIMAIFVTIGIFSFQGSSEEEILRKPAAELQRMAREAVSRAGTYEEQQEIVFLKDGFGTRIHGEVDLKAEAGSNQY